MDYTTYLNNRKPYQERAVREMVAKKHYCLFFLCGAGKTYPTVEACRKVLETKPNARILILSTPKSINMMWKPEVLDTGLIPSENVVAISYSSLINKAGKDVAFKRYDILIADECHKVKSISTQSGRYVQAIARNTEYVWGLSGTPRANSDLDIFCEFKNLWIPPFNKMPKYEFVDEWCITHKIYTATRTITVPDGVNFSKRHEFEQILAENSAKLDEDDKESYNNSLPAFNTHTIKLTYRKSDAYKNAEHNILEFDDYENTMNALERISKLHQIVNGHCIVTDEDTGERTCLELDKYPDKLSELRDLLCKQGGGIVVYRFKKDLSYLIEMLTLNNMGDKYTTDMTDFKHNGYTILLLQASCCDSVNLQDVASTIYFYTMDYSFINYDQMIHRVWRLGQKKDVNVYFLVYKNTIEETILKAVKNKIELANLFMFVKKDLTKG